MRTASNITRARRDGTSRMDGVCHAMGEARFMTAERGASLLYGLMFLLVASLVAALVLSASTTALERAHSDKKHQQDSLTLISGANLVRDCLESTRFKVTTITNKETNERAATVERVDGDGEFAGILENSMKTAAGDEPLHMGAADATGRSFKLNVTTSGDSAIDGSEVVVDYSIAKKQYDVPVDQEDNSYRISAALSLKGTSEMLFLEASCQGARAPETTSTATTTTEVEEVYWDTVNVSAQGGVS